MKKYIKPAIRIKAIAEDCSILAASGIVGQDKATITFSSENIVNPEAHWCQAQHLGPRRY